ncbi:MAG TPA: hypothetical protein VJP85_06730 [Candidatus Baltobacteraceae bacterium]|nr:hypothetical protein [Candidatus Baltobacteraceae bacterium]
MSTYGVDRYAGARGEIAIRLDAPQANRLLLALERLDQEGGLNPSLAQLRETLKEALVAKSSGDTDSAPSTE